MGIREKIVTWFSLIDINNLYKEIKMKEKGNQEADFADGNGTVMSKIVQCVRLLFARWLLWCCVMVQGWLRTCSFPASVQAYSPMSASIVFFSFLFCFSFTGLSWFAWFEVFSFFKKKLFGSFTLF